MLVNYLQAAKSLGFKLLAIIILFKAKTVYAYDFITNSGLGTTGNESGYTDTALNSPESIDLTIANILSIILSFMGIIFLFLIIVAGIRWMLAGGNQEEVNKSKHSIRDAAVGLVIVFGAYALVWLIVSLTSGQSLMTSQ